MKEKDLRPGTSQVLEAGDVGRVTDLLRVLGKAPEGQTYKVSSEEQPYEGSEGRYACVRLLRETPYGGWVGDPELLRTVTLDDFEHMEDRELAGGLQFEAIDSLAGLAEASEQDLQRYLVDMAERLVTSIERGINRMADTWDEVKPQIMELTRPRMWKDALGNESFEDCFRTRFGAALPRWRDIGMLEERVLELTTGDDAISNRMAAVIAGTSTWTVAKIQKDAGVARGKGRGADNKRRSRRAPPAAKSKPPNDAENAQESGGGAPSRPREATLRKVLDAAEQVSSDWSTNYLVTNAGLSPEAAERAVEWLCHEDPPRLVLVGRGRYRVPDVQDTQETAEAEAEGAQAAVPAPRAPHDGAAGRTYSKGWERELARQAEHAEAMRPIVEGAGGAIREQEHRKPVDPVTDLEVKLAEAGGAVLRVTDEDIKGMPPASRARVAGTVKEVSQQLRRLATAMEPPEQDQPTARRPRRSPSAAKQ